MRFFLSFFLVLVSCFSYSQGFKVKEFKMNISDGDAWHAPSDANGNQCGLVKVRIDDDKLQFGGNIVGEVENKMNEYRVYMSKGSKSLVIMHPNFLPMFVNFSTYDIDEVSSKATYIMNLVPIKFKEKNCLVVTTKPEDANLYLNDVFVENLSGGGLYKLYLEKGDYVCRIEKKGYSKNVQAVTIGKSPQNINAQLESVMAELEVKCKTATAEIYIDGELKGNGAWKGDVLAGDHQIEARQQNFQSCSQTISIAEKESRSFVIPELMRSMGKVKVVTNPSGMPVVVDGKDVGISPCTIDIESGKHYVSCKSYGVVPTRSNIEVNGGKTCDVELQIQYAEGVWKDCYERAYNGSPENILSLACLGGILGNYQEAVFWINRHPQGDTAVKYWQEYGARTNLRYWECDWIQIYSAVGHEFYEKKEIDKAIQCFEKAGKYGYEGLGDCYKAKGNKQLAASYYRKCLNLDYYDGKNRVVKKLEELEYKTIN